MEEMRQQYPPQLRDRLAFARHAGQPVTCIGWDGQVRGVFTFREQMRVAAEETVRSLRQAGIHVAVLTGDDSARASAVQGQLNIDMRAGLLPDEKLTALGELRQQFGRLAMVGDGIDDAPALASADVGIAMGCAPMCRATQQTSACSATIIPACRGPCVWLARPCTLSA